MTTISVTRTRMVGPVIVAVAMFGLAVAAVALTEGVAPRVQATTPIVTVAEDSIAVVRGGVASPLVPGERLAVAGDLVATIAVRAVPQTRYARTLVVTLANSAGTVDGGAVQVRGHMRYMDHGAFATRAVADGGGRYVVALPFVMPGEWELVVACGAGVDSGELVIDISVFE